MTNVLHATMVGIGILKHNHGYILLNITNTIMHSLPQASPLSSYFRIVNPCAICQMHFYLIASKAHHCGRLSWKNFYSAMEKHGAIIDLPVRGTIISLQVLAYFPAYFPHRHVTVACSKSNQRQRFSRSVLNNNAELISLFQRPTGLIDYSK